MCIRPLFTNPVTYYVSSSDDTEHNHTRAEIYSCRFSSVYISYSRRCLFTSTHRSGKVTYCTSYSIIVVWQVSDAIHGDDKSDHAESLSLQKALYITCFAAAIGSVCFLAATFYIHHDEHQVQLYIRRHDNKPKDDGHGHEDSNKEQSPSPSYSNSEQSIDQNYSVNNDPNHQ